MYIKKKLLSIVIILMCIFVAPTVKARTLAVCSYEYYSDIYGLSTIRATIPSDGDFDNALYVNMFNSEEENTKEEVENQEEFYNDYLSGVHKGKCPYYLYYSEWGDNEGYLYYDKSHIYNDFSDAKKADWGAHILVSKTIAEDWIDGTYNIDAQGDDYTLEGADWYEDENKTILFKCIYNYADSTQTSAVLNIYTDYTFNAYMAFINSRGDSVGWGRREPDKVFSKLEDWDNTLEEIKKRGQCPYYFGVDSEGWSQARPGFDITAIETDSTFNSKDGDDHILTSRTIAIDKADYDPKIDGVYTAKDAALKRAWTGVKIPRADEWNPDDPYSFHIADMFCSEPRVIKVLKAIGNMLIIVKFALPLMVIIAGTIDFAKAALEGKSDSLSKKAKSVGLRVLIGLFVFIIPTVTHVMFNNLADYNVISKDVNQCQGCLLNPNDSRFCQEWAAPEDYTPTLSVSISNADVGTKSSTSGGTQSTTGGGGGTNTTGTPSASETQLRSNIKSLAQTADDKYSSSNFTYLSPSKRDEKGCLSEFYYGRACLSSDNGACGTKTGGNVQCTKYGTDCNGFVSYLYHQAGLEADTTGSEQYRFFMHSDDGKWYATGSGKKYFTELATVQSTKDTQDSAVTQIESKAKNGDALTRTCTSTQGSCGVEHHVGVYIGNGKVIDNNGDADLVRDLKSFLQMNAKSGCVYTDCSLQIFTLKGGLNEGSGGEP